MRTRAWVLLGLALTALLSGCRQPPTVTPDLEFTRFRVNVDDKRALARVVGEIVNRGKTTVPEIEIHATLVGAGGSERGENMVPMRDLGPGESRAFALNITTHGAVSNVKLRWEFPAKK